MQIRVLQTSVMGTRGALWASGVVLSPCDAEQDLGVGVLVPWPRYVGVMFCWISMFLKASYFCRDLKSADYLTGWMKALRVQTSLSLFTFSLLNDFYCISFYVITLSQREMNLSLSFLPQTEIDEVSVFQMGFIYSCRNLWKLRLLYFPISSSREHTACSAVWNTNQSLSIRSPYFQSWGEVLCLSMEQVQG